MQARNLIAMLVTVAACGALTKMGMVPVTAEQKVPRPSPGNVGGVQVTFGTLEGLLFQRNGQVRYRPSVRDRQLRAWLTDYDANKICFGIEDYPAMNASITGTANPFERLEMSLVRSDGAKLTGATRDRFSDDHIDLYFMNDNGVYDAQSDAQYYYATARACFATKELFIRADTTSLTWNVGDSHYTFKFEPTTAAL